MDTTLQLDDGRTVKLRVRSPESYTPNLFNTNQGQERGKAALDDSLQKSGFHRGIVVAKDDQVVNGNHAYQSASELGVVKSWIEIEVEGDVGVVTKRLDWETAQDPKAIVAAIADNRVSELNFSIDTEAFQQALDVLAEAGLELPDTLYTEAELNETIAALGGDGDYQGLTDEDEIPDEEQAETRVKRGEVWQLGRHRIMCGDSTCKADVERLMDGKKADMVFTDPPYGVNYEGGTGRYEGGEILSKTASKIDNDLTADIYKNINNILHSVLDCGPVYVWFAYKFIQESYQSIKGMDLRSVIVWYKINQGFGDMGSNYHAVSEFCFYAVKGKSFFSGENNEKNVWELTRPQNNKLHPTQKPTELAERAIQNHDAPKVLDLFLGSGSTLIACEKTGRTCYGMELSEKYCDVILQRFQDFTGIEPQKVANDRLNIDKVK
ncbi:MAG: DNA methyltransferase [Prochlorotrichaceae cyanobacterium]